DTHSRRDYVHIYAGHELAATVKGRYKRHWIGASEGASTGLSEAYYDLYQDPREENPQLVPLIHTQGQFNRMRARHELFKKKYPDRSSGHGVPYTGLSNARPETVAIGERIRREVDAMPFDVEEYLEFEVPGDDSVGDWGH
ncbi:MAG: sulfatase, partial [Gammaproteobacteria bacterium]